MCARAHVTLTHLFQVAQNVGIALAPQRAKHNAPRLGRGGAVDGGTVREKLLNAHAFVLASWSEPLGVAYMEAMACGVPTFGTDAGGVPELIEDGVTGVLVPPRNPGLLARALRDFAANPDFAQRLSAAGRAEVEARFSSRRGAETLAREIAAGLTCATTAA